MSKNPLPRELLTFFRKIETPNGPGGCWEWSAATSPSGYGRVAFRQQTKRAHRVAYELFKGDIADDLTIDHLCRNTRCVNPDHLEAVTQAENIARAVACRTAHCSAGHALVAGNIYIEATGRVRCRVCRAAMYQRKQVEAHA